MGGQEADIPLIDAKGLRNDGRKPDEMRPVVIKAGVLKKADGSAYVEMGGSHAIAAVYGPREMHPKHKLDPAKGVLRCRYEMAPFSVGDRKRPGPDRRSNEISRVTRDALEPVVQLDQYPKSVIDVFIEILQADAGTRVTGLTAASVALADAGIIMTDLVAACASGKVDDTVVLDLNGMEDMCGQADVPVGYAPNQNKVTLLQMDGKLTKDEFKKAMDYAIMGCKEVYKAQKQALRLRYSTIGGN